jgi:hypothetical protein
LTRRLAAIQSVAVQPRAFSRAEVAFLVGVPVAWAILLLFHPTGDGDEFYPIVADETTAWVTVHVATLLFIPLMAGVVYLLLRGVEGGAARVSRIALAPFVLFYAAWEALIGIGLGLLVDDVNGLSAAEQATGAELVEEFADSTVIRVFELIGTGALIVALSAAALALRRRAGAPLAVPFLLVLAALPIAWHVTPFGQLGLALFLAAVLLLVRARPTRGVTTHPVASPTTA